MAPRLSELTRTMFVLISTFVFERIHTATTLVSSSEGLLGQLFGRLEVNYIIPMSAFVSTT